MKKSILLIVLSLALVAGVQAQATKTKLTEEEKKELKAKMDDYKARLKLTPEQEEKVETINMDFLEALSKIKEDGGSKMSRYKKFKRASSDKDKKMKEVLTSEQYKIYKEQQEEFKEEMKSRRG